jgi:hypothetical protein
VHHFYKRQNRDGLKTSIIDQIDQKEYFLVKYKREGGTVLNVKLKGRRKIAKAYQKNWEWGAAS